MFDVTLTIHRAGIGILTAYGVFSGSMSHEDVLKLDRFDRILVQDCEIPTEAIDRYRNLLKGYIPGIGPQVRHQSDATGYTKLEANQSIEFGGLLDAYRYYCIETVLGKRHWSLAELQVGLRSNSWHGYPIVFVTKTEPSYPTGTIFKKTHADCLAKLVLGLAASAPLRADLVKEVCAEDLSSLDDHSLYLTEGSGTIIYYGNHELGVPPNSIGATWIRKRFMTSVVVDMILLQRAILTTFNDQLNRATYNIAELTSLKQEYILALQEFEVLGLSHYGSVHDIIRGAHDTFRINDLRKLFELKYQGIENLIQGVEERQRASRERIVKTLTTLVAVIFSLSAANSVVGVVKSWPLAAPNYYPRWIGLSYSWIKTVVAGHSTTTAIILYVATVTITVFALWYETFRKWGQRTRVVGARGTPTSAEMTLAPIELTVESPEIQNERDPNLPDPDEAGQT